MRQPKQPKIKHFCNRCENPFFSKQSAPKYCGLCKSSLWKSPRKYAVTGQPEPTGNHKRTAPTGKAAAKVKPERIKADRLEIVKRMMSGASSTYKYNRDILDKENQVFRGYFLYPVVSALMEARQQEKILAFEYFELTETEPIEIFYGKRGNLYTMRYRMEHEIERLKKHLYDEEAAGLFSDHDSLSVERYNIYTQTILRIELELTELAAEVEELILPPPQLLSQKGSLSK